MSYDFSKSKAATANNYLNPGIYRLRITEVAQDKFPKGSPYLGVTFETEDGQSFVEKFGFSSDKAIEVSMSRLQYLHEGLFNKPCTQDFNDLDDVTKYFKKYLTGKPITKTYVVGGNENGNNVFACLPYSGFLVEDENVELGEFERDSAQWKKVVKKNNQSSEVTDKPNGLLNDEDDVQIGGGNKKAETAKSNGNGKDKKAEKPSTEKESAKKDDGLPW